MSTRRLLDSLGQKSPLSYVTVNVDPVRSKRSQGTRMRARRVGAVGRARLPVTVEVVMVRARHLNGVRVVVVFWHARVPGWQMPESVARMLWHELSTAV